MYLFHYPLHLPVYVAAFKMVDVDVYGALLARVREQSEKWAARTAYGDASIASTYASPDAVYSGSLPSRLLAQQSLIRLQRRGAQMSEEESPSTRRTTGEENEEVEDEDERERRQWRRIYAADIRYAAARRKLRSSARASALAAESQSRYAYLYDVVLLAEVASRELPRPETSGVERRRRRRE